MDPHECSAYISALYTEHSDALFSYAYRLTSNRHLAEDIVADTFVRALVRVSRVDGAPHPNPHAWLRRIARNLVTDHHRRSATRLERPVADAGAGDRAEDLGRVSSTEFLNEVTWFLDRLTDAQREVVLLSGLLGWSTAEIAVHMGRSPQAVRSLRHKASHKARAARSAQRPVEPVVELPIAS